MHTRFARGPAGFVAGRLLDLNMGGRDAVFSRWGGPSGRDDGGQGAVLGAMVHLVAMPTWGDGLPVLASNVGCVEGWV